ncbi:MAG TPA: M90 family metallopeptidase [Caldimonas sp.]
MTGWWRRWRRARTLERRAIPDPLWQLTLARYPFLAARPADKLAALREMATLFLAQKEFSGAGGLVVSDEMAVAIAAQACLPALELGLAWFDGFVGIVVHPDAVVARREHEDEVGVVHEYDEELSGEAMDGGPVMLAWRDVDEAGESAAEGYNVVIHEFAHVIDMRRGITAGAEDADRASERGRWLRSLRLEHERFARRVDRNEETFLDPYGAEALEEFFAVGSEAFFVAPDALRTEQPRLYRLLTELYRQDPVRDRKSEGGHEAPSAPTRRNR